jgi:hypothetical protein
MSKMGGCCTCPISPMMSGPVRTGTQWGCPVHNPRRSEGIAKPGVDPPIGGRELSPADDPDVPR